MVSFETGFPFNGTGLLLAVVVLWAGFQIWDRMGRRRGNPLDPVMVARTELEASLQKRVDALEKLVAQHEAELKSWRSRYDTLREDKAVLEDTVRQLETDKRSLTGQLDDWHASLQMEEGAVQARMLGRMLPRRPGQRAGTDRIWPTEALNSLVELLCDSPLADQRDLLVTPLPKALQAALPRSPAPRTDLTGIVWTAAGWTGPAMRALLGAAATALAGSQPGERLAAWQAEWQADH